MILGDMGDDEEICGGVRGSMGEYQGLGRKSVNMGGNVGVLDNMGRIYGGI